jgi:hypothetical protein
VVLKEPPCEPRSVQRQANPLVETWAYARHPCPSACVGCNHRVRVERRAMSLSIAKPGDLRRAMALSQQVERPREPALASGSIDDECAEPGSRYRLDASNAIASDDWMQLSAGPNDQCAGPARAGRSRRSDQILRGKSGQHPPVCGDDAVWGCRIGRHGALLWEIWLRHADPRQVSAHLAA